jgi:putative hydrolase of the HAD superfamily
MPIRAILFDAVGTLIYAEPPVAAAYAEVGRRFGIALDEGTIRERFRRALLAEDEIDRTVHRFKTTLAREQERWRRIVAAVFKGVSDTSPIFDSLWQHFAFALSWRVYGDVTPCLAQFIGRSVSLGIATNFDDRLQAIVNELEPLGRCEHVFVSSRIGWRKPAVEFFRSIERALGLPAAEILLVGDDWENDVAAGRDAGWQTVFVNRGRGDDRDCASIRSLGELPSRVMSR